MGVLERERKRERKRDLARGKEGVRRRHFHSVHTHQELSPSLWKLGSGPPGGERIVVFEKNQNLLWKASNAS